MVLSAWGKHLSGPIFAVLSLGLAFAYAHYADNPTATTWLLKWAAYVSGAMSAFLIFIAQYEVWKAEYDRAEEEKDKRGHPEVIIKNISHDPIGMVKETVITLQNVSPSNVAQRVKVATLRLTGVEVSFRELPLLGPNEKVEIGIRVKHDQTFSPLDSRNLAKPIYEEWTSKRTSNDHEVEFAIPGSIDYEDLYGNGWRTDFDFCFYPKAHLYLEMSNSDSLKRAQILLEAKRFKFSRRMN